MKKLYITLVIAMLGYCSYAQNTFPSSGNVGIGTTSPGSKLYIAGGGRNGLMIDRSADGTSTSKYISIWQGTGAAGIDPIGSGSIYLGFDQPADIIFGGSTPNGIWKANGKVGIGTSTPGYLLDVNGAVNIGSSTSRGTVSILGSTSDVPGLSLSDLRTSGHSFTFYSGVSGIGNLDVFDQTIGQYRFTITSSGNIGIGTTTPDTKLSVNGTIHTKEVKVDIVGWPDYVFKPTYKLPSLTEVKTYINKNQRLPDMPSAQEVEKNGVNLGELVKVQTKKIEELTLYLIEKDEKQQKQEEQISGLLKDVQILKAQLNKTNKK